MSLKKQIYTCFISMTINSYLRHISTCDPRISEFFILLRYRPRAWYRYRR